MSEIRVRIPDRMLTEAERRVEEQQFRDLSELVHAALRYYLERHSDEDWDAYVQQEVAWSQRRAAG